MSNKLNFKEWENSLLEENQKTSLLFWGNEKGIYDTVPTDESKLRILLAEIYSRVAAEGALKHHYGNKVKIFQHPIKSRTDMTIVIPNGETRLVETKFRVHRLGEFPDEMVNNEKWEEMMKLSEEGNVYFLNNYIDGGYAMWKASRICRKDEKEVRKVTMDANSPMVTQIKVYYDPKDSEFTGNVSE